MSNGEYLYRLVLEVSERSERVSVSIDLIDSEKRLQKCDGKDGRMGDDMGAAKEGLLVWSALSQWNGYPRSKAQIRFDQPIPWKSSISHEIQ
jgi:hypothetical protein